MSENDSTFTETVQVQVISFLIAAQCQEMSQLRKLKEMELQQTVQVSISVVP